MVSDNSKAGYKPAAQSYDPLCDAGVRLPKMKKAVSDRCSRSVAGINGFKPVLAIFGFSPWWLGDNEESQSGFFMPNSVPASYYGGSGWMNERLSGS